MDHGAVGGICKGETEGRHVILRRIKGLRKIKGLLLYPSSHLFESIGCVFILHSTLNREEEMASSFHAKNFSL